MFNLEPSALEDEIYNFVLGKLNAEGSDLTTYEQVEDALMSVFQEVMAQHKTALHFKHEALKVRGDGKC